MHIAFLVAKSLVTFVIATISIIFHWVIRVSAYLPAAGILVGHHSVALVSELKVLVLDAARIRRVCVGVVHNSYALKIRKVVSRMLETKASVFQRIEAIVVISIDRARIDYLWSEGV